MLDIKVLVAVSIHIYIYTVTAIPDESPLQK